MTNFTPNIENSIEAGAKSLDTKVLLDADKNQLKPIENVLTKHNLDVKANKEIAFMTQTGPDFFHMEKYADKFNDLQQNFDSLMLHDKTQVAIALQKYIERETGKNIKITPENIWVGYYEGKPAFTINKKPMVVAGTNTESNPQNLDVKANKEIAFMAQTGPDFFHMEKYAAEFNNLQRNFNNLRLDEKTQVAIVLQKYIERETGMNIKVSPKNIRKSIDKNGKPSLKVNDRYHITAGSH